ncbi:porin family protein [Marivirga sp.]|uniref:porin family protein n=1 Tax=Marivirga sp. TaxID=2018662 RepID=UPI0025E58184|nr:porin family protein [Marivirga sp.]
MKFYLISFFIAFLATSSLQAQHMNIGVKGGLNMYNVVNENGSNREPLLGFNLGLIGHFHLSDQFALQPEVVFSTQGAKFSNNGVESQLYLNYINVPVLLQYMFDNGFRLFAGPQLGFLISAKSNSNNTQMDMTSDFKGLEFGASLGVSYINPDSNLGIDARYNLGLTDINENNAEASYNRGFQLGLFYLFNHK